MTYKTTAFILILLACIVLPAQAQEMVTKECHPCLYYHSKQYEIMQSKQASSLNIYSLQNWGDDHDPLVIIKNKNGEIAKVIKNKDAFYYPDITVYDLNGDSYDDIIIFWAPGPSRAQIVEVWMNKDNADFEKIFDGFAGRGAEFKLEGTVPTLSLHYYTDSRIKEETFIYKWNGKMFEESEHLITR